MNYEGMASAQATYVLDREPSPPKGAQTASFSPCL